MQVKIVNEKNIFFIKSYICTRSARSYLASELASLVELVYVLCTKSQSILCIPMGIHRNEIRS